MTADRCACETSLRHLADNSPRNACLRSAGRCAACIDAILEAKNELVRENGDLRAQLSGARGLLLVWAH